MKKIFFILISFFLFSSCLSEEEGNRKFFRMKREVDSLLQTQLPEHKREYLLKVQKKMNKALYGEDVVTTPLETKSGVVYRVSDRQYQRYTVYEVILTNGHILSGEILPISGRRTQINDFFFAKEGDTIIYSGDKVIAVKFKD